MKKIILVNEMVLHQHQVIIDVEDDEELENILNDLDRTRCNSADDAYMELSNMGISLLHINEEYLVDVDSIEYDSMEPDEE